MRTIITVIALCGALASASPSHAETIDIGNLSFFDFGFGAELRIENTTAGTALADAFTDLLLTVDSVEYGFGRIDTVDADGNTVTGVPDFYDASLAGFVFESVFAGTGISFFHSDPFASLVEASVVLMFGGQLVTGGGTLALFDQPISLFANIDEGETTTPVPEPGTLLLLGIGVLPTAALARKCRPRRPSRA